MSMQTATRSSMEDERLLQRFVSGLDPNRCGRVSVPVLMALVSVFARGVSNRDAELLQRSDHIHKQKRKQVMNMSMGMSMMTVLLRGAAMGVDAMINNNSIINASMDNNNSSSSSSTSSSSSSDALSCVRLRCSDVVDVVSAMGTSEETAHLLQSSASQCLCAAAAHRRMTCFLSTGDKQRHRDHDDGDADDESFAVRDLVDVLGRCDDIVSTLEHCHADILQRIRNALHSRPQR